MHQRRQNHRDAQFDDDGLFQNKVLLATAPGFPAGSRRSVWYRVTAFEF
jgi:hypothetical protein